MYIQTWSLLGPLQNDPKSSNWYQTTPKNSKTQRSFCQRLSKYASGTNSSMAGVHTHIGPPMLALWGGGRMIWAWNLTFTIWGLPF